MSTAVFKNLAKAISQSGERETVGEDRIITQSELTLILGKEEGKLQALAIIFPLFGVEFIMLSDGTISLSSGEEEGTYLDLQDEATLESVNLYLTWRTQAIVSVNL